MHIHTHAKRALHSTRYCPIKADTDRYEMCGSINMKTRIYVLICMQSIKQVNQIFNHLTRYSDLHFTKVNKLCALGCNSAEDTQLIPLGRPGNYTSVCVVDCQSYFFASKNSHCHSLHTLGGRGNADVIQQLALERGRKKCAHLSTAKRLTQEMTPLTFGKCPSALTLHNESLARQAEIDLDF